MARMCASDDGKHAHVDNLSSSVIDVSSSDPAAAMNLETYEPASLVAQSVRDAVPGGCDLSGNCVLPSERTLDVTSDASFTLFFDVDDTQTLIATGAAALARWATSVGSAPRNLPSRVATCAQNVSGLTAPAQWQEDVRGAITTSTSCAQLTRDVLGEPAPDENAVADRVTSIAEHLDSGLWIDSLSFETARILSHVH